MTTKEYRPAIVSRADARAAGATWYYTGVPCRRKHLAMRYTKSGHCAGCLATKAPGSIDNRTLPRVVRLRYDRHATADQRKAFGEYLRVCVDAFHNAHAPALGTPGAGSPAQIVRIEKV